MAHTIPLWLDTGSVSRLWFYERFSESVSVSSAGRTVVVGAAQPLSMNIGDLLSRALVRR